MDEVLASLYGVETKALKQAVRRNMERFPSDFMFQLNKQEVARLRSQIVTSNGRGGRRYARADLVVLLLDGVPVLGIIVEAQLSPDERKRFVWPAYVVNLRARLEVPVCLLVVTADEATARWVAKPLDLGGGNLFTPLVLGPAGVPEIVDEDQARDDPELAVLSAMAHGRDADYGKAAQIALAAQIASLGLDEDRSRLYFDLVLASLSEAARQELTTMDPAKYEYQSEFAKRYVAQGEHEGRADLVTRLLTLRFGSLSPEALARIAGASIEELDAIGERLLTVQTLEDALGPPLANPSPQL